MDVERLVALLRGTLQPEERSDAEKQLIEICRTTGFPPALLHLVMSYQLDIPVRQAGAVYLKNMILHHWVSSGDGTAAEFVIHDSDKNVIRDNIVEAVIVSENLIRVQLSACVSAIIKSDYPDKWPSIAEKIVTNLESNKHNTWLGSLICLYQLVKNFEYKKADERQSLDGPMSRLLPRLHHIAVQLFPDPSDLSVLVQKQILKVFFSLIQYYLPLNLITRPAFTEWMELVSRVADRPVPEECDSVDEDSRADLVWWKCKKWSLHILTRCFQRYGSPSSATKDYQEFAQWFLPTFSEGILLVMLRLLDRYRTKQFVPRRVLQMTISYVTLAVAHSVSWKVIQPHVQIIIQDVVFPLLCHTDEDEQLWNSDPIEYIRTKYDVYEEFFNPSTAAQTFLREAAAKRVVVLHISMSILSQLLGQPKLQQKSGALCMLGTLAEVLLKKSKLPYCDQIEMILVTYVFPDLTSEHGCLRAKACWVIQSFSELQFKDSASERHVIDSVRNMLHSDKDVPVRLEAAVALQMLLKHQPSAKDLIRPYIQQLIGDLLQLIRETENDDLTCALQRFVCTYSDEIAPLAIEVTKHLAQTFVGILGSTTDGTDDKAMTVMGVLNTLETICSVMEDQAEILPHIESIVLEVIGIILQQSLMEFFEELLSLVDSLTSRQISARMWQILPHLYRLFFDDNTDLFVDMMPSLYNYVTVDPDVFLSQPCHMEMMFNICRAVLLSTDVGEDTECHAAKLLEIILLQFKGSIDHVVPAIVELVLYRMRREIRSRWLQTACLNVIIAAICYNPSLSLLLLQRPVTDTGATLLLELIKRWLANVTHLIGLHDRKLFLLGICTLLSLSDVRQQLFLNDTQHVLSAVVTVFTGLQHAYEMRCRAYSGVESGKLEKTSEEHELGDDDDVVDDNSQSKFGESDDDDDDDSAEETALEVYDTVLDKVDSPVQEYQMLRGTLLSVQMTDPEWYQQLVSQLSGEQRKDLEDILQIPDSDRSSQSPCLAALLSAPVV